MFDLLSKILSRHGFPGYHFSDIVSITAPDSHLVSFGVKDIMEIHPPGDVFQMMFFLRKFNERTKPTDTNANHRFYDCHSHPKKRALEKRLMAAAPVICESLFFITLKFLVFYLFVFYRINNSQNCFLSIGYLYIYDNQLLLVLFL